MRLRITVSGSREPVPFDYPYHFARQIHKWLGENNRWHNDISLYSYGMLSGGTLASTKKSLLFKNGGCLNITAWEPEFLTTIISGIEGDPFLLDGMFRLEEVEILEKPTFETNTVRFLLDSPVLLKKRREDGGTDFITFEKPDVAAELLTSITHKKMRLAGLDPELEPICLAFDMDFETPKTKLININGIANRCSICPVIAKGSQRALQFVWSVGLGNSTGVGFGAVK